VSSCPPPPQFLTQFTCIFSGLSSKEERQEKTSHKIMIYDSSCPSSTTLELKGLRVGDRNGGTGKTLKINYMLKNHTFTLSPEFKIKQEIIALKMQ